MFNEPRSHRHKHVYISNKFRALSQVYHLASPVATNRYDKIVDGIYNTLYNLSEMSFLLLFFPFLLSQNFRPAASAPNLGVTFDYNLNFVQHISQTFRCSFFMTFVTFALYAYSPVCLFLSPKPLHQLLLAVCLTIAIPLFTVLLRRTP